MIRLRFDHGTLVAPDLPEDPALRALFVVDPRTRVFRAPGQRYREIATWLHRSGLAWTDEAKAFEPLPLAFVSRPDPFPYQAAALDAWVAQGKRGVVVLPTGAGKTVLAMLAMEVTQRPTLVVVPTLSLLTQWKERLAQAFGIPIGAVGGGEKDRQPVTVTTYDSASAQAEFHGNRFGLVVFDECHHLPSPTYRFIAEASIAPYRLGLTATPERSDGGEGVYGTLIGPVVHREQIGTLEGTYLAPYEIVTTEVALTPEEETQYLTARGRYLEFIRREGIAVSAPDGWRRFLIRASRSEEGRAALAGWREQRRIALASRAKLDALWSIVVRHRNDRVIVFTEDNETVHRLATWLVAPVITHHTPAAERQELLGAFARGELPLLLTSKVLNEGVDVPEANVGVVLSGNGSVREHVQRLGRILRRAPDKRAVLYEIRSAGTTESQMSERRRQHDAYRSRGADEGT